MGSEDEVLVGKKDPETERDLLAIAEMDTPVGSKSLAEDTEPSILDLTRGDDSLLEVVPDGDMGDVDVVDGKSLEDILKTTVKKESDWRHKTVSGEESFEDEAEIVKSRRMKLLLFIAGAVLVVAVVAFFVFKSQLDVELDIDPAKMSFDKFHIPPGASDVRLRNFHSMACRLLSENKKRDAERVFKQLRKRGWRGWLITGGLGECALARSDKEAAGKLFEEALSAAPVGVLEGAYREDYIRFAVHSASFLAAKKDWKGVADVLGPLEGVLPDTEKAAWASLALAYFKLSEFDKALKAFDHVRTSVLTEEQLRIYASLLERKGRRHDAFDAYLCLLRGFDRSDVFDKVERLAPDTDSLVMVLMEAAARSKNKSNGGSVVVRVAKALMGLGRESEALSLLRSLNPDKLDVKGALTFLRMLPKFKNDRILVLKCHDIVAKRCPENIKVQKELMEALIKQGEDGLCQTFFREEGLRRPNSAVANYMNALMRSSRKEKELFISKALRLNPSFYEALLDYGKILLDRGDWAGASKAFASCVSHRHSSVEPRRMLAIVKMKMTGEAKALTDYESFLRASGASKEQIIREMVLLSRYLPDPSEETEWLAKADGIDSLKSFVEVERLFFKLARGTLKDSDFDGKKLVGEIRKIYMIYLFGEGRERELLLLPTKPEAFPEFWKVYAGKRMGLTSWRHNAELIIKRRPDNLLESTCAALWLGKIGVPEAEKALDDLPYEEKPLLCAMLADRLRDEGEWSSIGNMFAKALKYDNPNLYVKAIRCMMKKRR